MIHQYEFDGNPGWLPAYAPGSRRYPFSNGLWEERTEPPDMKSRNWILVQDQRPVYPTALQVTGFVQGSL